MKRFYIFTIAIILFSSIRAQKGVVINVLDKSNSSMNLSIRKSPKIRVQDYSKSQKIGNIERITDSTYIIKLDNILEPQILHGTWLTGGRNHLIIVSPGDSINAIIKPPLKEWHTYEVTFHGKNEENYNKYADLNEIFNKRKLLNIDNNSLKEYIQKLDSTYTVNTRIIEKQVTSPILKNIMLNEEIADFFFYLLSYTNSVADLKLSHEDVLKLKNKFFKGKITNNSPLLMNDSGYTYGIKCLSNLLIGNTNSEHRLMTGTDTINKYFDGEIKEFLLTQYYHSIYMQYAKNDIGYPDMDQWFNLHAGKMEKEYNDFILFTYNRYKKQNKSFPEEILNIKLTCISDSSATTFRELLDKYKGKQIVLNNWASWCGPCAHEIREGRENVKELKKRGNHFIYLSLDKAKDFNKAKAKATELDIIDNAYIVSGDFDSAYVEYLNIKDIPRFILIDKDGKLKKDRVSNPSSGNFYDYN